MSKELKGTPPELEGVPEYEEEVNMFFTRLWPQSFSRLVYRSLFAYGYGAINADQLANILIESLWDRFRVPETNVSRRHPGNYLADLEDELRKFAIEGLKISEDSLNRFVYPITSALFKRMVIGIERAGVKDKVVAALRDKSLDED